ncbi:PREDICTED: uncharacterized protein LOC101301594 [Fragaria vesca subsp. vesca]|uniref:uncharacterized protein LOC101301594 n=1 Tax=Fragaria vesca subsp. vesca TaxID=101020 RepID=UPI0002C2FE90|nr:PREDICTED: uncharacterized protein LOC101301594 [Fragaria vesca subsp. vesca]
MAKMSCFSLILRKKKKKVKGDDESAKAGEVDKAIRTLQLRLQQQPVKTVEANGLKPSKSFGALIPYGVDKKPIKSDKEKSPDSVIGLCGAAFESEDEHEESPINSNGSDLQASEGNVGEEVSSRKMSRCESDKDCGRGVVRVGSGHLSDPGVGKAEFWGSRTLTRSCSNLETHKVDGKMQSKLRVSKNQSFDESVMKDITPGSPASVRSHCSADKVMLKKHSSSQVLPSRSRRLWWKLFLWSHRNLHKSSSTATPKKLSIKTKLNKQGGYSSDTLEPNRAMQFEKLESPLSFNSMDKGKNIMNDDQSWSGFQIGSSSFWPQNQWVAFSTETSSSSRVMDWMKDLDTTPSSLPSNEDENEGVVTPQTPPSPLTPGSRSSTYFTRGPDANLSDDTLHANTIIQTLNSSSTVAHISSMNLKAIPNISCFCSLRSVNLSNNFIVHITPGSLPKSLHTLDLSKNKISSIEGLRDLTRLRVLNLSYNRISRIGRGLSGCSILKELYLAGNKISDVEGLHRLLKLTVLDLSFNKITTTKALGQLVANYNSLQGLNLLGNPIQNNIGDEQLRKTVVSLLPKLVFLNKQSIKPPRSREAVTDSVAKAALGKSGWNPRRKTGKKLTQSFSLTKKRSDSVSPKKSRSFSNRGHKSTGIASVGHKRMLESKSIAKVSSAALPSSSH